ncbi:hypothetical protein GCM10023310_72180 [Paenibacillus vulneris]|uniref:BppU N-terminal domain-containing protein n=1 Tax=Paenibacillus vulneris TaxID=1133364 RepID=A0ABW3UG01_9BACL
MIQQYVQYNDPVLIVWRKGTPDDPFLDKSDSLKVINNMIVLSEIPSDQFKVTIAGLTEIDKLTYERRKELQPHEFLVNYSNGIVQFHPSQEFKTLFPQYKGRGQILYPASRIYSYNKDAPYAEKNLQDIINEMFQNIRDTEYLIEDLRVVTTQAINATNSANSATNNANLATNEAIQAKNEALDAAASTIMIYKGSVPTYDDLTTTYPVPENGWRVTINDTGDVYRYDGVVTGTWVFLGNSIGSIPVASDTSTGLLDKENYKNFTVRTIAFVMPMILKTGIQNYVIQFPFDGVLHKVSGFCVQAGTNSPLELQIEKVDENGFLNNADWKSVLKNNFVLDVNSNIGLSPPILDNVVKKGDYFRINVLNLDNNIKGVTIQLDIKI